METASGIKAWINSNRTSLLFLSFLVLVTYAGTLNNSFVADDVPGILNNPVITDSRYILATPMMLFKNILYFLLVKFFGRSPTPFHLMNLLFHLGNVWLIYYLVEEIVRDKRTATIAATFVAVHPILTEGVSWISGGQYARYSFFLLLSLALYVRSKEVLWYYFSIVIFLLALLNSEKAVVFPLILIAYELAFGSVRKTWEKLAPYFILSTIWGVLLLGKVGQRISDVQTTYYQSPQTYSPLVQIPIAITEYLKLIIWPNALTLYHSEMSFTTFEYAVRFIVFLLFVSILIYGYKKNKQIFFWGTFFIISLLPTLTPLGISWVVAERYVYLGAMGVFVLLAIFLQKLLRRIKSEETAYAVLTFIVLLLSIRTIVRNNDWQNQDSLWLAAARTSPSSPQNHNNLGDLYGRRGELERSAAEFKKAIELNPNYADAYHNLGNTYQQMGKPAEAIKSYQKAVELNSNLWQSYQNMAAIYFERGEFTQAEEEMQQAIRANPANANLYLNLGVIYLRMEDNQKAKEAFQEALKLDPQNNKALTLLSQLQ
jgi:tetratricopeptide (TPR) repeat protein